MKPQDNTIAPIDAITPIIHYNNSLYFVAPATRLRFCISILMTISTFHSRSALADEHCSSCSMAITSASCQYFYLSYIFMIALLWAGEPVFVGFWWLNFRVHKSTRLRHPAAGVGTPTGVLWKGRPGAAKKSKIAPVNKYDRECTRTAPRRGWKTISPNV